VRNAALPNQFREVENRLTYRTAPCLRKADKDGVAPFDPATIVNALLLLIGVRAAGVRRARRRSDPRQPGRGVAPEVPPRSGRLPTANLSSTTAEAAGPASFWLNVRWCHGP